MDVPSPIEDPLAQPTRARLFAVLCELRRPAPTEELAARLGLHPNGVRAHLERLEEAALVTREQERRPRGRPRDLWLVSPQAAPAGERPTAYAELGTWLARTIKPGRTGLRTIETAGREIGRELAPEPDGAPEVRLHAALAALGFQPRREARGEHRLGYRLANCPYREAAQVNPEVVCGLHRGLTRGLLDVLDPGGRLTAFVPQDPLRGGCLIELSGALAGQGLDHLKA